MNTRKLIGKTYKTATGVTFTVLCVESYQKKDVSERYKPILGVKPGHLVAVNYRGTLIPNITLEGGVARIISVSVGELTFDRPRAISEAIGIKDGLTPYIIKEVK